MKTGLYDKEGNELSLEQACSMLPLGKVINHVDPDESGARAFVKYADMNVSLSPQDDGRTLKVFLSKK